MRDCNVHKVKQNVNFSQLWAEEIVQFLILPTGRQNLTPLPWNTFFLFFIHLCNYF